MDAHGQITSYVVVYNGGVNVAMDPGLSGCTSQSGYGPAYASLYPDNPGFKSLQALLLAAYISGKPISLYLGDDTCRITELRSG